MVKFLHKFVLCLYMVCVVFCFLPCCVFGYPWYFELNGIGECWNNGIKGDGVLVEILDSQIYPYSILEDKVVNFVKYTDNSPSDYTTFIHGTAMAVLIAGRHGQLTHIDSLSNREYKIVAVAGVAPNSYVINRIIVPGNKMKEAIIRIAEENTDEKISRNIAGIPIVHIPAQIDR